MLTWLLRMECRWLGPCGLSACGNRGGFYGPDLMLEICRQAQRLGHRIFLYGGREQTMPRLLEHLKRMFPQLTIAGTYCPPFRPLRQRGRTRPLWS